MKKELRKKYLALRAAIPEADHKRKSEKIHDYLQLIDAYKNANTVMIFLDFRGEVSTRPIINTMLEAGKIVALPVVNFNTKELVLIRIESLDHLVLSKYNIYEPLVEEHTIMAPTEFDLILAPGAAFDLRGYRIGYGGGFYDKLLAQLNTNTTVVGLAFSEQMIDEVPKDSYDQPIHAIITDEGYFSCNA